MNYSYLDYSISSEKKLLGTGGAIKKALKYSKSDNVFVLNGDTFCDFNLNDFFEFHLEKKSNFSIALHLVKNNVRYGNVLIDKFGIVLEFMEKEIGKDILVNSGVYILNKNFIVEIFNKYPNFFSIETDFFQLKKRETNIFGIKLNGEFIDIGIPEDYQNFQLKMLRND